MDLTKKKVTVVGMGKTSMALVRLLLERGANPYVTEQSDGAEFDEYVETLRSAGVPHETGGHSEEAFQDANFVVPSPGVRPTIEPIARAVAQGAEVLGEMELASRFTDVPIIAVTGTNGKTTTTELLRAMIAAAGHDIVLAGNNECPLSEAVTVDPPPDYIVLEVSSYQLETTTIFRPWIGIVLNVTDDHLARHGTIEKYASVKERLFVKQGAGDFAIVNEDDSLTRRMAESAPQHRVAFSLNKQLKDGAWLDGEDIRFGDETIASIADIPLRGRHNLENVLAALAAACVGGFEWNGVLEGLRGFPGVEHRIEHVDTVNGVAYYNDSKSTNVDSLRVALESFDRPLVLIAGGRGKGGGYDALLDIVEARVRVLVAMGEEAPRLEETFGHVVHMESASDMADAVHKAADCAAPGETVLLSPGCASFDMFKNFEDRGKAFKECVRALVHSVA